MTHISFNKTKIVATIGPASANAKELAKVLKAGADVIRVNGAHGSEKEHRDAIALVRKLSKKLGLHTAVMVDLPGPKFRVGTLKRKSLILKKGAVVRLECGKKTQTTGAIPVPHNIHKAVKPKSVIFINDGAVKLRVLRVKGKFIECKVEAGGEVLSHKGINLPLAKLSAPSLTKEDKKILRFALANGADYISLSFVRSAKDIIALRKITSRKAPRVGLIAKIEKPEALYDLKNIIAVSDAIMIARGDLGIETPFDKLPTIQREILKQCRLAGKPSITATQMLESMVNAASPTRAEATDVAGAVWEGSDAVMLSAETSVGINPAVAVSAMARIAAEAESSMQKFESPYANNDTKEFQAEIISNATAFIAESLCAKAIVAPTRSGRTPLFISKVRPSVPILAPTEDEKTARRMNLYWGVKPLALPTFKTVDELLARAEKAAKRSGLIKRGDTIVIASGAHGQKGDITRIVEVRRV